MLQFIAKESEKYSIPEQVQMALEGGCKWIELDMLQSKIEDVRQVAMEIIPLCQESQAFFTLTGHIELSAELKVHGVQLTSSSVSAHEVRESLGPEAVIGVMATSADEVLGYVGADVDYVQLRPGGRDAHEAIVEYGPIVKAVREAGCELPIVAIGGITEADIPGLLSQGVNGVAIGKSISESDDPVKSTESVLKALGV